MKKFKQILNESSLSRIWQHNVDHDCAAMTAFRTAKDCGTGDKYTTKDNLQRNKILLAKILSLGYGATKLKGVYPEGGVDTKEISYWIVDLKDSGNIVSDMKKLGKDFEQDSVLIVPKGSINNDAKAYLLGTNNCKNNWLGMGKKEIFQKGSKIASTSKIYTSYVNGRPFIFEDVENNGIVPPGNGMGWWSLMIEAQKDV